MARQTPPLTRINLDDLVASFGWQDSPLLASTIRRVFFRPADKFARQMLEFDSFVGEFGLCEGARRALRRYVRGVRVYGRKNLPASGPVLVLSNHPGMSDTLALFTALDRADLKIIALRRPFLQSLPHTSSHLFYVGDDQSERIRVVRHATAHLKEGGAVLTFPSGRIEPDPDVYKGALEALEGWTDSAGVFMRFVPDLEIVPVLVRNVLWDRAVHHPLTRLKPEAESREKLGAAFQLLAQILFDVRPNTVKVQIGPPLSVGDVGSTEMSAIHTMVIERMRNLVENPPVGAGEERL